MRILNDAKCMGDMFGSTLSILPPSKKGEEYNDENCDKQDTLVRGEAIRNNTRGIINPIKGKEIMKNRITKAQCLQKNEWNLFPPYIRRTTGG